MAQFYSAKRRVTTRQIITVTVNDLDPFGQGVARHQGIFFCGVFVETDELWVYDQVYL